MRCAALQEKYDALRDRLKLEPSKRDQLEHMLDLANRKDELVNNITKAQEMRTNMFVDVMRDLVRILDGGTSLHPGCGAHLFLRRIIEMHHSAPAELGDEMEEDDGQKS